MTTWCASKAAACALLLACGPARAGDVVSLNLCTDELLVQLAPARVTALSPLARDPSLSVVAAQAAGLPWVRADAESVLRLAPRLVLAGDYGAQGAVAVLRRRGVPVVQVAEPDDFAGVTRQVADVASALGVPVFGAALVARMKMRLAAIRPRQAASAVLWQARGFTAGAGSFGDAVLRAAGFSNAGSGRAMGVEAMVARPPDMLVVEQAPAYPSLATDMLAHPALAALRRIVLPPTLLACPGPWSVRAVELLTR